VNAILVWQTGNPFTVLNGANVSGAITRADRPDVLSNPFANVPTGYFFNPAAFASQAPGTLGNEQINAWHGPNFQHLDLSLAKTFRLTERFHLDFRVESFNVFNTPSFLATNTTLGTGEFGKINGLSTNYTPRVNQFALKLHF
jgi:hypothetical protein